MMQWKCLLLFTLLSFVLLGCSPEPAEDVDDQMDLFQTDFESDQSDAPRGMRSGDRARGMGRDGKEVVHGSGMGGGRRRRDRVGRSAERLPRRWQQMDDGDDRLDREEFLGVSEEFDRIDVDQDGYIFPRETKAGEPFHVAFARQFEHVDADSNGEISEDEWGGLFAKVDADADGNMTPEELRADETSSLNKVILSYFSHFDRDPPAESRPGRDGDMKINRDEWMPDFALLDRIDPDGKLGRDEINAAVQLKRYAGKGVRRWPARRFLPRYQKMDQDENQEITTEEYLGGDEEFTRLDFDKDGLLTPQEVRRGVPTGIALIYRMKWIDSNGDDGIGKEEWTAVYTRLDVEKKQSITREMLRELLSESTSDEGNIAISTLVLKHFSHFDRNRDGAIEEGEWQERFETMDFIEPQGLLTTDKLRSSIGRQPGLDAQKDNR